MPVVAYCKKCKKEVPLSEMCMSCGKKLPKNSERMSWFYANIPLKDWISWNHVMRIFIPLLAILFVVIIFVEWLSKGTEGLQALFSQGIIFTFLGINLLVVLLVLLLLFLQGKETIQFIIDQKGIHAYTFLAKPTKLKWVLRLQPIPKKNGERDLTAPVAQRHLLWAEIKGIGLWPDKWKILLYSPKFWLALPIHCTPVNYEEVLQYMAEKLNKKSKIKIHPPLETVLGNPY